MRYVTTLMAFVLIFVCVFVLAGLFLRPHLPPTPERPVTALELGFWIGNWSGAALGLFLGILSARATWKRTGRRK